MNIILVIPAYKPEEKLIKLVDDIEKLNRFDIVVVDDGGGATYKPIFDRLQGHATVLVHEVNRGKGAALKTALNYIIKNRSDCDWVITADADGQHTPKDISRIADECEKGDGFILGVRMFTGDVPLRSRFGNSMMRGMFTLATGARVQDTQTGLRAIPKSLMPMHAEIEGDRYEYEMNALMETARAGVQIRQVEIETVYENNNEGSHFNPLKDSMRIMKCLLKFTASSLIAFVVDYVLFAVAFAILDKSVPQYAILISTIFARAISSACNYTLNKKIVFKSDVGVKKSLLQYYSLVVFIIIVNYLMLNYLFTKFLCLPVLLGKIITECVLFFFNYWIQKKFIFAKKKRG